MFSSLSLTSYGHTTALPPDYAVQKATGDLFANTVRALYGEIFTAGSTANLLCKFFVMATLIAILIILIILRYCIRC